MKKFFTAIPLQIGENLKSYCYQAVGNTKLQMKWETSFPIIAAMHGYLEEGDVCGVVVVVNDNDAGRINLEKFREDVEWVCGERGVSTLRFYEIWIDGDQQVASQTSAFQNLIRCVEDDDELFCCMTYGTKPQSTAMMMAVQYAYRVKRNTSISCVVYGEVKRQKDATDKAYIYDMTALIQLDEIVRVLADRGVEDPKEFIDQILSL